VSYNLLQDPAFVEEDKLEGPVEEVEVTSPGYYPRMLVLGSEVEDLLATYIDTELEAFFAERAELLEDWKNWQTLYWAKPESKERTFPFKRAANIVIPLAAIAVEAIHARTMNTLFSVKPFWSIRPKSKVWVEHAKPFERWLQSEVESSESLDMYEFCNEALLEFYKLGTVVAKSGYERLVKKTLRNIDGEEQEYYAVVKNGATIDRVPLANFVMRFAELDPQTAPLVGERHTVTWSQLKKYAQSGRMDPEAVEKIKAFWRDRRTPAAANDGTDYQENLEKLANAEPLWYSVFDFYELWISFDVDRDGWDEEIVVDYHKESRTFLSIRYNWYDDLHRPYRVASYFKVEGIWPGIGVCKQVEQFQASVTTIHRQRLDNATLANMGMLVLRKGSGYGPGEPIFPGKMWFVDDVRNDIMPLKLNEIYPSSYANESAIINYSDKRVGVNDLILGIPQEGTPATATSDVARLAESNKRFDLVLKNIKRWLSEIGVDIITNYQIFGDQQVHWLVLDEEGAFVEQVLRMPSVLVRRGAVVELTVTDTITNREVEKAQWLQLFQILTNFYQSVFQLSQVFGDPSIVAQFAQKALIGTDEVTKRLLETYNITDVEKFTLSPKQPHGSEGPITPTPWGFPAGITEPNGAGATGPGRNRLF
jgi:hypothetical protein